MSYAATVLNVLIASPSDVSSEREAIAQSLHDWNGLNSNEMKTVLLPVMWESHSAPAMGDRPQAIINEQIVRGCDMLIGAFWTRLGSHTGKEESGTVEEIKWFLKTKKPVMLYFSKAPIVPEALDAAQFQRLQNFKKEIRGKGLQEDYGSLEELNRKLARQLTIIVRETSINAVVDTNAVRRVSAAEDDTAASSASSSSAPGTSPFLKEYSEKSFLVLGDTKPHKDALKAIGGKWLKSRAGEAGWCFSKRRLSEVATLLGVSPTLG